MPEENTQAATDDTLTPAIRTAIEIAIRLGTIALLAVACLTIIAPFLGIVAWAVIIAIAAEGAHEKLARWLGGRRSLAAALAVSVALLVLIVPAVRLSGTLMSGAQEFARGLSDGTVQAPHPDQRVADWPLIGPTLYENWKLASQNLSEALSHLRPQLVAVSGWLLNAAGSAGAGILQLVASILIAGVMLARGEERHRAVERFAIRMAGAKRGPELAALANATVGSVVQGILGVAFVQAVLAGVAFMLAGVPAAGLWALLVLVAAVVQLPVVLVMIPPVVYGFSSIGGITAVLLAIWCLAVSLLDNFLKPILFGRGVEVPSLVIFMGAIGGMLTMGIIGLFLGSVVLALGFALFTAWLSDRDTDTADSSTASA
jgi:predicted PurR-regulated permease PerM